MIKPLLCIYLEEAVLRSTDNGSTYPVFEPGVITALGTISSFDAFELVLIIPESAEEDVSEVKKQLQEHMLQLFRNEGIDLYCICTEQQVLDAWNPEASQDTLHESVVIGCSERPVQRAQKLSCRALLLETKGETLQGKAVYVKTWREAARLLTSQGPALPERRAEISRKTSETDIFISMNLDGTGRSKISTGLNFLDHMLHQLAKHGKLDLTVQVKGDLEVDEHHTIEDTAIVLGQVMLKALGDKRGIRRYGFLLPMDDALAEAAVDFSGRPWLLWDVSLHREYVGDFPTDMIFHFFKSFSDEAKCNLSLKAHGDNDHHIAEALFKAFARAVRMAVQRDPLDETLPSTKGAL